MQTIESAIASFLRVNRAKSPATRSTYATGLNAFCKYLQDQRIDPAQSGPAHLPERSLEQFYLWLVDRHGRDHLSTVETYLAGLRGLLKYLASEAAVPQISLERSREQLQRVKVRKNYSTPRVDSTLALIVNSANQTPLPDRDPTGKLGLRLLRDRAILNTLYATGMRRAEVASLNRADLASGRLGKPSSVARAIRKGSSFLIPIRWVTSMLTWAAAPTILSRFLFVTPRDQSPVRAASACACLRRRFG